MWITGKTEKWERYCVLGCLLRGGGVSILGAVMGCLKASGENGEGNKLGMNLERINGNLLLTFIWTNVTSKYLY